MPQSIQKVCVVGAGFMGSQIALHCALHGRAVWLHDLSAEALARAEEQQRQLLIDQVVAGVADEAETAATLGRLRRTTSLAEAAAEADIVIEVVKEDLELKRTVFAELERICPPHTILTTNSSSLRVSRIESATTRPDKVLNTHFVQPVWKHPFVELMGGSQTSTETMDSVKGFMESMGLLAVLVRKENTGFVFNCIWRAVKRESLRLLDQGVASVEDIDRTWMIQMESDMGPFAMMDRIGLDVVRDIEQVYYEESGDPRDAPPRVLEEKISSGDLGVKTGHGFYSYPQPAWLKPGFLKGSGER
ncbi:MAG: 3-hydroxyacyl-CoA dehydrogenase NAD-binding domain-containing protein [Acidobacteria bacterium]|nr:3-hydroxyacyl-CoA dehydrogenase NAD-binding domain-containing protein [Acidobacteriota bacterium]MDA1236099.1 3-hydroxyacyl-CoA dehydrogenase NAD-binding domain-containing protein [Acidobacteriota bacterium]